MPKWKVVEKSSESDTNLDLMMTTSKHYNYSDNKRKILEALRSINWKIESYLVPKMFKNK